LTLRDARPIVYGGHHGSALQRHQAQCGERTGHQKRAGRVTDEELFTRLFYYGISQLHLSWDEVGLMPFGLLLDLWECHKQFTGMAKPKRELFIDDIIPYGI